MTQDCVIGNYVSVHDAAMNSRPLGVTGLMHY